MSPFHHPVHKMDTEIDAGRNISHTGGDRRGKSNGAVKVRNSEVVIRVRHPLAVVLQKFVQHDEHHTCHWENESSDSNKSQDQ